MGCYVGQNFLDSLGFTKGLETYQIRWRLIDERFEFPPNSNESREFDSFLSSKEYQNMVLSHHNMPRLMLCSVECCPSKELILTLKETDYTHTTFIWHNYYQRHKQSFAQNLTNRVLIHYPNSFCLHLLIETDDKKIVQTTISSKKQNDYPNTICYTIGEQLEFADLKSDDFVDHWIRRALCEEFGILKEELEKIVDDGSFRVLGLYYEKDIFNFALLCIVRTRLCFADFYSTIKTTIDNDEIKAVDYIDCDSIPHLLKKLESSSGYHPSTWMRLSIFNSYT